MNITDDMVEMVREELQVPDIVPDEKVHDLISQILGDHGNQIKNNLPPMVTSIHSKVVDAIEGRS